MGPRNMRQFVLMVNLIICVVHGDQLNGVFHFHPTISPSTGQIEERNVELWRTLCHNFSQGDQSIGEFSTPNYPSIYPSNVECIRVIHVPIHYTILLDFRGTFFEIEQSNTNGKGESDWGYSTGLGCPYDYLEVRNGPYGFSPFIGRYCGHKFPPVIAADSGSMWLMFKTDRTLQYRGFRAIHYAAPKLASPDPLTYKKFDCSFSINLSLHTEVMLDTDEMKTLYKGLLGQGTQDGQIECVWRVEAPSNYQKLRLNFDQFNLPYPDDCSANSFEIYTYTTSNSNLLKRLCGTAPIYMDTKSHLIYIRVVLAASSLSTTTVRATFVPYTRGKHCNESMFWCGGDTCLPRRFVCNGRADCVTEMDEKNCAKSDPTVHFFNSPYLSILIITTLLIFSIITCTIYANVHHRLSKRGYLSNTSRTVVTAGPTLVDPLLDDNAKPAPELAYGSHPSKAGLPTLPNHHIPFYLCHPDYSAPPAESAFWLHPYRASTPSHSTATAGLSYRLWSPSPITPGPFRSCASTESTVAYCSSQSTASSHLVKKPKSHCNRKFPSLTTSRAYYQNHSSSSSTINAHQHKFWARMEDLITTTEESSAQCKTEANADMEHDASNLSDLTAIEDDTGQDTDCGEDGEQWILDEIDAMLEYKGVKIQKL